MSLGEHQHINHIKQQFFSLVVLKGLLIATIVCTGEPARADDQLIVDGHVHTAGIGAGGSGCLML